MSLLAAGVLALGVSFAATRLTLGLARRRRILDVPNARSSHRLPTPSGGGLGILLGIAAGLVAALATIDEPRFLWIVPALALVGALGWRDDRRPLSPLAKLLLLFFASAGLLVLCRVDSVALPYRPSLALGPLALPLLLLWLTGFANLFNFMDGIDGIAALTALVSGSAFALAGHLGGDSILTALGLVTAAAAAGFLPWNFPRARIFMGDTGSLPLGLLLAFCAVRGQAGGALAFPAGVLLLGPFVFDAGYTLFARALRGDRVWEAHREHLYQRLARRLGSHVPVSLLYAAFSVGTALLALRYGRLGGAGQTLSLLLPLLAMAGFALLVLQTEGPAREEVGS